MSKVADNSGKLVEVPDLGVPASRIYSFVERQRVAYFEDHSLDWALDEIITCGMNEITRKIKSADKLARDRAAGQLFKQMNLTPAQAQAKLAQLEALLAAQQATEAKK
jgi:hypothetical protein